MNKNTLSHIFQTGSQNIVNAFADTIKSRLVEEGSINVIFQFIQQEHIFVHCKITKTPVSNDQLYTVSEGELILTTQHQVTIPQGKQKHEYWSNQGQEKIASELNDVIRSASSKISQ